MDRKEKKVLHLKISHLLDQKCSNCENRSIKNSHILCKENCSVGKELIQLSSLLLGKIQPGAKPSEHPLKTGRWSSAEEIYLINHYKLYKQNHLAIRLNRSVEDVYKKVYRLKKANKISC